MGPRVCVWSWVWPRSRGDSWSRSRDGPWHASPWPPPWKCSYIRPSPGKLIELYASKRDGPSIHVRLAEREQRVRRMWVNVLHEVPRYQVKVLRASAKPVAERGKDLEHVNHAGLPHRLEEHDTAGERGYGSRGHTHLFSSGRESSVSGTSSFSVSAGTTGSWYGNTSSGSTLRSPPPALRNPGSGVSWPGRPMLPPVRAERATLRARSACDDDLAGGRGGGRAAPCGGADGG